MTVTLDAREMGSRKAAHAYLKEQLSFPEHYGFNLDALHDCLTEYGELEVTFVGAEEAEDYFAKVLRVFRASARENDKIKITVQA